MLLWVNQGNVDELRQHGKCKGFISREMAKSKTQVHPKLEVFHAAICFLETYEIIDKIDESIERRQQEGDFDSQDMSEEDSQQDSEE